MKVRTKAFGEVELAEDKVITFKNGIIGYPELTHFALLHDEEKGSQAGIRWLQSLDEESFSMPVMDPLMIQNNYDPTVEEDWMKDLGDLSEENLLVLVTVRVPSDLTQMSVNLQGPIIINVTERKACQIIVDPETYPIKFPIYEILKSAKGVE
ncbi:MAG: flagellar assembly protein FliW [Clostridium sp.]|jgi:flagellar assembly factor FliW|nr:flagellar assembly protein FliW [Clostridium sp.]